MCFSLVVLSSIFSLSVFAQSEIEKNRLANNTFTVCEPASPCAAIDEYNINSPRANINTNIVKFAQSSAEYNYWFSFGDSYTQTGFNPYGNVPSPGDPLGNPYYPGRTAVGGTNWIDVDTTVYNKSLILTWNYADGGATIDSSLVPPENSFVRSLKEQVSQFLSGAATRPVDATWGSENSLFSFWIGINDINISYASKGNNSAFTDTLLDAYFELIQAISDRAGKQCIRQKLETPIPTKGLSSFLRRLLICFHSSRASREYVVLDAYLFLLGSNVGGRNFLFVNVPPIDRTPLMLQSSAQMRSLEKSAVADFNFKLASRIAEFSIDFSDVSTWLWDSNTAFTAVLDNPAAYGFTDITSYGSSGDFWGNNFHPSSAAHEIWAREIATLLVETIW